MSATEIGAMAAVAGVVVTILSGLAILIWNAGRHSQRLDGAEAAIKDLKATQDAHGRSITAWDQAMHLLQEVRDDVKDLLTGRIKPTSRRQGPQ